MRSWTRAHVTDPRPEARWIRPPRSLTSRSDDHVAARVWSPRKAGHAVLVHAGEAALRRADLDGDVPSQVAVDEAQVRTSGAQRRVVGVRVRAPHRELAAVHDAGRGVPLSVFSAVIRDALIPVPLPQR